MPERDALDTLARIEAAQAELHRTLAALEPRRLFERPASGEWSPIENVRHLIFAEQHHFKPHLPRGFRWSSAGVPPPNKSGERRLSPVGSDASATLDEVFDAWAKVPGVVRELAVKQPSEVALRLEGNLKHIVIHAAAIERLLRG